MGKRLEEKVRALETYRNIIMHAETYLDEIPINDTFDGLANMLDVFFFQTLGKSYRTISGYGEFVKSFQNFQKAFVANNQNLKAKTLEVFISALKTSELTMGPNELKRFTDVEACAKFIDTINTSSLTLGIDIYNGYCAGRTTITRKNKELFEIMAEDKLFFCEFKLKSLILYLPNLTNQTSPIIFVECDSFTEKDPILKKAVSFDYHKIQHVDYYKLSDGTIITGEEKMEAFYESDHNDDYKSCIRFYSAGIMCFLNIQGLRYNYGLKRLVEANRFTNGKDFEVGVRDFLEAFENY